MTTSPTPLYLVIDQGGQSSRALVFNRQGKIVSQASVAIQTFREGSARVEHKAEEIISSIKTAIAQSTGPIDVESIDSIGLACQRSSIVCWDRQSGAALSPVLSWQDTRAGEYLDRHSSHAHDIHALTGLFLSPHYGASKLRWCLDHLPDVRLACEQERLVFGPLASYILFKLLQERPLLADPVCASRTLLCNLQSFDWDQTLLDLFEIPRDCLPRCVPNQFDYGSMLIGKRAVPLTISTGDQPASLFMSGPPVSDSVYINIGTGAFLQRLLAKTTLTTPSLLSSVIWQSGDDLSYVLEGTVNGAASALQKTREDLNLDERQVQEQLKQGLVSVDKPPLFLNGISGVGSPYWRSEFDSRFIGEGDTMEKLVAVIESIVFLVQANLDEMDRYLERPGRIVLSGGLSAVAGLCQRLASLSGLPVHRTQNHEATAQGLAWLLSRSTQFEEAGFTEYEPCPDPGLSSRYEQWRHYMDQ